MALLDWFRRKHKTPICDHSRFGPGPGDIQPVIMSMVAGTTDFLLHIVPLFRWEGPCSKCGKVFANEGILPRHLWPNNLVFNDNGWPLDAVGDKLPTHGEYDKNKTQEKKAMEVEGHGIFAS